MVNDNVLIVAQAIVARWLKAEPSSDPETSIEREVKLVLETARRLRELPPAQGGSFRVGGTGD